MSPEEQAFLDGLVDQLEREGRSSKAPGANAGARDIPARPASITPNTGHSVDPRPTPHGGRDNFGPDPSPSGPLLVPGSEKPSLISLGMPSQVGVDVNDAHRLGIPALSTTNHNLREFAGGLAGGTLAGKAAELVPGVSGLVNSGKVIPAAVGGLLTGAASGAGSTAGGELINGEVPTGRDLATGAVVGGTLGTGIGAVRGAFQGAPARDASNTLAKAGEGMKSGPFERFFTNRDEFVKNIKADPELKSALGDKAKTLEVIAQRLPEVKAEQVKILASGDAKNGPLPVATTLVKTFGGALNEVQAVGGTENNAAANAVDGMYRQYVSGIGKDPTNPPAAAQIRQFMTDVIGPKITVHPVTGEEKAVNTAAGAVYRRFAQLLDDHVGQDATKLQTLNGKLSMYTMMEKAASGGLVSDARGGTTTEKVLGAAKHMLGHGVSGGIGYTIGNAVAGPEGGTAGALAGMALGPALEEGVSNAAGAVTSGMASRPGQALGKALTSVGTAGANLVTPKAVDLISPDRQKNRPIVLGGKKTPAAEIPHNLVEQAPTNPEPLRQHLQNWLYGDSE